MKKIDEEKYFLVDQTLPEPPFNITPHWSIPVLIVAGLLLVAVGWVVFGWWVYYTTPELWIQ